MGRPRKYHLEPDMSVTDSEDGLDLVPMAKGGETILVHPAGVKDHIRLKWVVVEGEQ